MEKNYLSDSDIDEFYEKQFACWPELQQNYASLANTERKIFSFGDFPVIVQYNPGRRQSTEAKVDKQTIESRPCFLCQSNRPSEQLSDKQLKGWEILVNPYPVFPVHFTIVSDSHVPQGNFPFSMIEFSLTHPLLAVFFNGSLAGASAPDHYHFQAVLNEELPLLRYVERKHTESIMSLSHDINSKLPFGFISFIIPPDRGEKLIMQLRNIKGIDAFTSKEDHRLINIVFWIDAKGMLRCIVFPRYAHRPKCFFEAEGLKISPGALDMMGIVITTRKDDFVKITEEDIKSIFSEISIKGSDLVSIADSILL